MSNPTQCRTRGEPVKAITIYGNLVPVSHVTEDGDLFHIYKEECGNEIIHNMDFVPVCDWYLDPDVFGGLVNDLAEDTMVEMDAARLADAHRRGASVADSAQAIEMATNHGWPLLNHTW